MMEKMLMTEKLFDDVEHIKELYNYGLDEEDDEGNVVDIIGFGSQDE